MKSAPEFDVAYWPQFSLYNLVVANLWPLYWVAYFVDRVKVDKAYWHVFDIARERVAELFTVFDYFSR